MFASEKVMLDYLSQLLTEEEVDKPSQDDTAQQQVSIVSASNSVSPSNRASAPTSTHTSSTELAIKVESKESEKVPSASTDSSSTQFRNDESATTRIENTQSINTQSVASTDRTPKLKPIVSGKAQPKPFMEAKVSTPEIIPESEAVAKLLQQVSIKQQEEKLIKEQTKAVDSVQVEVKTETKVTENQAVKAEPETFPDEPFQALFFQVAGLQLAVPLQELGGIHNLTEVNSLFGKPDWFYGVMLNREEKLNVVDAAKWVMPEKYSDDMEAGLNYKYVIMLGESQWGLTAELLVETELIQPDAVKWRKGPGKRPWLAGTIKEKMCALLHVSDLIAMLEQGVNARQE
jgi:purine-binding chemotaxis protein CheW